MALLRSLFSLVESFRLMLLCDLSDCLSKTYTEFITAGGGATGAPPLNFYQPFFILYIPFCIRLFRNKAHIA